MTKHLLDHEHHEILAKLTELSSDEIRQHVETERARPNRREQLMVEMTQHVADRIPSEVKAAIIEIPRMSEEELRQRLSGAHPDLAREINAEIAARQPAKPGEARVPAERHDPHREIREQIKAELRAG